MTRDDQKDDEMFVSEFFVDRVNKVYGFDYFPEKNEKEKEKPSIDVYARSKDGKNPEIKIQLTTCDDLHKFLNKSNKFWDDLEKGKEMDVSFAVGRKIGINLIDPIKAAIHKKEDKLKKKKREGDEILILHNDFAIEMRPFEKGFIDDYLLPLAKKSSYRGVFLIITPTPSTRSFTSFRHDGQIVALRNIFGADGEIF